MTYDYDIFGIKPGFSDEYESNVTSMTISKNGKMTASVTGIGGPEGDHSGACSALLVYSPKANSISISGGPGKLSTKCFNVLPLTAIHYTFTDTGGACNWLLNLPSTSEKGTRPSSKHLSWSRLSVIHGAAIRPITATTISTSRILGRAHID